MREESADALDVRENKIVLGRVRLPLEPLHQLEKVAVELLEAQRLGDPRPSALCEAPSAPNEKLVYQKKHTDCSEIR